MLRQLTRLRQLLPHLAQIPQIAATSARHSEQLDHLLQTLGQQPRTRPTDMDTSSDQQQKGHEALLRNLRAIKANWPLSRTPLVGPEKNLSVEVPDLDHRRRVQGGVADQHPELEHFIDGGFITLRAVLNIAEVFGVPLNGDTVTMDWGVGCSRMLRHLPPVLRDRVIGTDVDPVNIAWSREHMPFGSFAVLDPYGRFEFEDRSIDFIYSHSVLTHLREPDQDHWLKELNRVCRGTMILSIHGLYSIAGSGWGGRGAAFARWLESGFNTAPDPLPDIADVTDKDYYTGVAQTPDYVRTHWSKFVEVVEIIPGGFGRQHDAVVCRPKPAH